MESENKPFKLKFTKVSSEGPLYDFTINFKFWTSGKELPLPLRCANVATCDPNSWHQMYYAIDASKACWYGKEHCMELISTEELLRTPLLSYEEKCEIHRALGMKEPNPPWAQEALDKGWTPPKGFEKDPSL